MTRFLAVVGAALILAGAAYAYGLPPLDQRVTSVLDANAGAYAKVRHLKATCRDSMGHHVCLITRGHAVVDTFVLDPAVRNVSNPALPPQWTSVSCVEKNADGGCDAWTQTCWWRLITGLTLPREHVSYFSVCAAGWRKSLRLS